MKPTSKRHLVFEIERVQTVRRRVPTYMGFCNHCRYDRDLVELSDLAKTFNISLAEAVLQLRDRGVHMQHPVDGGITVCTDSLLTRPDSHHHILTKSLSPGSALHLTDSSES